MKIDELDYNLPDELIAQEPLERRDEARLLVLNRNSPEVEHSRFYKLARYLNEGDLLILNDTRVMPARMFANKESGGRVEILFVRPMTERPGAWQAMVRAHRPLKVGTRLLLDDGHALVLQGYARPGRAIVASENSVPLDSLIRTHGILALPHYINREVKAADADDYQTVYASHEGAIAAPTAGLHFTDEVLRSVVVEQHSMEAEWYVIPPETLEALALAKRTGGRIIAVGTSSVRTLESHAVTGDAEGFTGLFIHPGFRFKLVDAMITNFHMPRTTVLALVMAMAGREKILAAYREAIRHRYRFLSYGDAMLIL